MLQKSVHSTCLTGLYVGIYYVCALYFTFKNSKVKIKGIDGTKYIAALMYTSECKPADKLRYVPQVGPPGVWFFV